VADEAIRVDLVVDVCSLFVREVAFVAKKRIACVAGDSPRESETKPE